MRLLKIRDEGEISLTKDFISNIPPYAILSHTWGDDDEEVSFREVSEGSRKDKIGYRKIKFCGEQAARDGIEYFWVDTCCIDKSNNTELSEALNSMFRWYRESEKCYVYLADISASDRDIKGTTQSWELAFRTSRWFTRGWTLQELIAPPVVEFFSLEGKRLGDKKSLEGHLHEITGISLEALRGSDLSQFSVKQRLSWAENRTTKREEDKAYSLLGIFEVHLPLIYGEGMQNAMHRLLEEIDKRANSSQSLALSKPRQNTIIMPRNDFFTGREDILHLLHQSIDPNEEEDMHRQKSCVLNGLGGSGKTQIALEYTYRYRDQYQYIFWLPSESAPELAENYSKIASVLNLVAPSVSTDQKRNNKAVWKWLSESEKKWLLVFDNVTNVESIRRYIPAGSRGSIIYTTQSNDLMNLSKSNIQVRSFNPEEGARLLVRYLQDDNYREDQLRMTSELVGGLPLAIAHVAGYVNSSQSSLRDFMDVFKHRRSGSKLWSSNPGASTYQYEKALGIVFEVALGNLTPDARELIDCLAFLSPDSMPEAMLFHEGDKTTLAKLMTSRKFQGMELRKTLSARHLVERCAKPEYEPALSIHRSLKQALLYKLDEDPEKRQRRFDRAFELVRNVFPRQSPYRAPVNSLWPVYEKYLPQVLSLHASYVTSDMPLAPSLAFAELLSDAGNYLWERSLTENAFTILATATDICDQVLEIDDPNPIRTSILAVIASFELNQSARMRAPGLAHKIRILTLRRKYMASKPVSELTKFDGLLLGSALNNLAGAYMNCDDWENAETALLESLEVKNKWSTEQDAPFPFAEAYKNIGLVRLSQNKIEEALKLIERAVGMMHAWKGPRTKASQYFKFVWAFMLENCGRQEEALAKHTEILAMRKEILGEESAQTLDSYYSIGAIHYARNELDEAEAYLLASLKCKEEWYGPNTARAMFKLSQVFEEQKKYDESRRWYQDARNLRDTLVSTEYPCPGVNLDEHNEILIYDQLVQIWSGRTSGKLNVGEHGKNQKDARENVDSLTRLGKVQWSWWSLLCFWR